MRATVPVRSEQVLAITIAISFGRHSALIELLPLVKTFHRRNLFLFFAIRSVLGQIENLFGSRSSRQVFGAHEGPIFFALEQFFDFLVPDYGCRRIIADLLLSYAIQ